MSYIMYERNNLTNLILSTRYHLFNNYYKNSYDNLIVFYSFLIVFYLFSGYFLLI